MGQPLRDVDYFRRVRVDPELGTIVWPNGFDLDPTPTIGVASSGGVRFLERSQTVKLGRVGQFKFTAS